MDFKSRFHGKTSVLTKQGLNSLFSAPGNPIVKYVPPPQSTNPSQRHHSESQFFKKPFAATYDKPTSSIAAFRPKGNLKKSKYSNFFQFNGYIGPVQEPTSDNQNAEEPFHHMSKSLLATLNRKAKEREALYQSATFGSPARQNPNFEKNQLAKSPSEDTRYLSPIQKREYIKNIVVPSPNRDGQRQPLQKELRNTYNHPQHTQRVTLSRQKSVQSARKDSMDSFNNSSDYSPVRAAHLTQNSQRTPRVTFSRQQSVQSVRKVSVDSHVVNSSDYSPARKSFSHPPSNQIEQSQSPPPKRVVLSRQKSERKSSMDSQVGSSDYSPAPVAVRSTFSGLPSNEMRSMYTTQKDLKLKIILSKDRDTYGLGSRERYFKNFRRTRSDAGNNLPNNFLSQSLNAEDRMASRGEYQDYIYEENPRNRNNSYLQETTGSSKGIGYREVVTDRYRLPTIEREVLNKSRVFEPQNSSFKSLSSRGHY